MLLLNRIKVCSPVFIMGIPRSGTTLMQSLLDGHPELVVDAVESGFFQLVLPQIRHLEGEARIQEAEKLLLRRFNDPVFTGRYYQDVNYADVHEAFQRMLSDTRKQDKDLLSANILAIGLVTGQFSERSRYWVEKTPSNEMYAVRIFDWWSDAKCIHLIRDPRAILASAKIRSGRKNHRLSLYSLASYWMLSARLARRNRVRYGQGRYLVVYYENLVQNLNVELTAVCQMLGIADHEMLYRPTKTGGRYPWRGNSALQKPFEGVEASNLKVWPEHLTPTEVAKMEALVGREMQRHEYQKVSRLSLKTQISILPGLVYDVAYRVKHELLLFTGARKYIEATDS